MAAAKSATTTQTATLVSEPKLGCSAPVNETEYADLAIALNTPEDNDQTAVWRYMDFDKFSHMVASPFPNKIGPNIGLFTWTSLRYMNDVHEARWFRYRGKGRMPSAYAQAYGGLYVLCWSYNKKSDRMVAEFSTVPSKCVAIESNVATLMEHYHGLIPRNKSEEKDSLVPRFFVSKVRYSDRPIPIREERTISGVTSNVLRIATTKQASQYSHERELRILAMGALGQDHICGTYTISEIVKKVWIPPEADPWLMDATLGVLERAGAQVVPVSRW